MKIKPLAGFESVNHYISKGKLLNHKLQINHPPSLKLRRTDNEQNDKLQTKHIITKTMMEIRKYCFCYNPACKWPGSTEESLCCPECGYTTCYEDALVTGTMIVFCRRENLHIHDRINHYRNVVVQNADIEEMLHFINAMMISRKDLEKQFLLSAYALLDSMKKEEIKHTAQQLDTLPSTKQQTIENKERYSSSRINIVFQECTRKKKIKELEELIEKVKVYK